MTLNDLLNVLMPSDRILLEEDGTKLFIGYKYLLDKKHDSQGSDQLHLIGKTGKESIKHIEPYLELKHRHWKDAGLIPPICPEMLPDLSFSDLEARIWIRIQI